MLVSIYIAAILFSLHSFLVLYINASFLSQFFSPASLGLLYIFGACLNLVFIILTPTTIVKTGVHRFLLAFILLEGVAVLGMRLMETAMSAAIFFTLHQMAVLMIFFLFDLFLERASYKEAFTGRIRSVYLTLSNVALVISPFITGSILGNSENFSKVYSFSFLFLIPLFFIVLFKFPTTGIGTKHGHLLDGFKRIFKNHDKRDIIFCRFVLEFFYAIMVIYMAIYLHDHIGFAWKEIGVIFTIMLLPFVLFEIPLGNLSDRKLGEKEILAVGFLIGCLSTVLIIFVREPNFIFWATILFLTRVGASAVEIGTESFFFKHVNARDAGAISLFRATRPLSFIIAPICALIVLSFFPFYTLFLVAALMMAFGGWLSLLLKDTK